MRNVKELPELMRELAGYRVNIRGTLCSPNNKTHDVTIGMLNMAGKEADKRHIWDERFLQLEQKVLPLKELIVAVMDHGFTLHTSGFFYKDKRVYTSEYLCDIAGKPAYTMPPTWMIENEEN